MTVSLSIEGVQYTVELYDCPGAKALKEALPFTTRLSRWGDEYYGTIDAPIAEDDTVRTEMQVGEVAFWSPGSAFCIFFGPTPASVGDEPRAASEVVPLGKIAEDTSSLKGMGGSVTVMAE